MMLHTKCEGRPSGFRQDFFMFSQYKPNIYIYIYHVIPRVVQNLAQGYNLNKRVPLDDAA